jgi:hypothetical protein
MGILLAVDQGLVPGHMTVSTTVPSMNRLTLSPYLVIPCTLTSVLVILLPHHLQLKAHSSNYNHKKGKTYQCVSGSLLSYFFDISKKDPTAFAVSSVSAVCFKPFWNPNLKKNWKGFQT